MDDQCFAHLTEVTLAYPNIYDDGETQTEVDLWGPETIYAMPGAAAWTKDRDSYHQIFEMMVELGMHWDYGPYRAAVLAHIDEMKEWEDHGTAYEQWCQEEPNMDDLHEPSYFMEWNIGEGAETWAHSTVYAPRRAVGEGGETWVGDTELENNAKIQQYTPEMLIQRETLNWCFNFLWNDPQTIFSKCYVSQVPETTKLLTLTAVGPNHAVAKCELGGVFVPKSALTHLYYNGGAEVGKTFDGEITFTSGNKFPWRITRNGVKNIY